MKLAGLKTAENAHDESIWASAWVPATDSRPALLLTGSLDETVRLWRTDELSPVAPPSGGHALGVVSVAAHPGGVFAASASLDSFIRVFDIESNISIATLEAPPSEVWNMQFEPKLADIFEFLRDKLMVSPPILSLRGGVNTSTTNDITYKSSGTSSTNDYQFPKSEKAAIISAKQSAPYTSDNQTGGSSASVKLWDTSSWQLIDSLAIPRQESSRPAAERASGGKFVLSVAWSPDGKRLACGSMDGTISVFDVHRAKFLHHLEGHFMPVRSLVYSPLDSRVVFSACDDTHVHMYDAEGKNLVASMSGHSSWVLSVDASPDGAAIATGSSDRTVRLWDLTMRASVQTMTNHSDQVWSVAFRPPGGAGVRAGRLASVSDDKSISLYDYS